MADAPDKNLPHARATNLFARTVFRQLRRAGYTRGEIVSFLNEMMDLLATEPPDGGPLSGIADPETRIANFDVLVEALAFEMRRARDTSAPLLVVALETLLPDWTPDDAVRAFHERIARQLPRAIRPEDTVARIDGTRYAIVLSSGTSEVAGTIIHRIVGALAASRRTADRVPDGTIFRYRALELDGASGLVRGAGERPIETPDALLARTLAADPVDIDPRILGATPTAARGRSTRPPPPAAPNEVVLALGGGAARAAAHIGVLKSLRLAGVRIAGVAGTSAGALVGAMYLAGMTEDEMLERFASFTRSPTYARMRRLYAVYRRQSGAPRAALGYFRKNGLAFLSNNAIAAIDDDTFQSFIEHFVGPDTSIDRLAGRFAAVATDLTTGRETILSSGPLHFALRATCAVPGLFQPQALDGRMLVDGSTIGEVPVRAAASLRVAAPVLAVYLARPVHDVSTFSTSAEVFTRTTSIVHSELVREQLRHAPELITAFVEDIAWLDFRLARETFEIGFAAANAYLARAASRLDASPRGT